MDPFNHVTFEQRPTSPLDATFRVHLSPQAVLQDEQRMKRLKATLCDGIFRYADEPTAVRIIEDSAKICGASPDTLSQVLQTKFFAKHTPFYWVIINRHSQPGTPPLLTQLFSACTPPLTKEAQEDVLAAFYTRYDSDLYLHIRDKLPDVAAHVPHNASYFGGEGDRPVLTAVLENGASSHVVFKIPRFFDRLVVDEKITLEFLALDACWRLEVSPTGSRGDSGNSVQHWKLNLEPDSKTRMKLRYRVRFTFRGEQGVPMATYPFRRSKKTGDIMSLDVETTTTILASAIEYSLAKFNDNPFTANQKGELSGSCVINIR